MTSATLSTLLSERRKNEGTQMNSTTLSTL